MLTADDAGGSARVFRFDEYGIPQSGDGAALTAANGARFLYTSQAWLPELGMYYYKARIYSPTLGRFMQTDPIGYKDQVNLYAYVANDPVNSVDPDGKQSVPMIGSNYDTGSQIRAACQGNSSCEQQVSEEFAKTGITALSFAPVGGLTIRGLELAARALGIGQRVATPAAKTAEVLEALLPKGVTRQIFAQVGVWRTEGGVAAAATRSREVSSGAIQGLKDARVSKGAVSAWQKFYQGVTETVRADGTKLINETAKYRSEVLQNVLRDW